MRKIEFLKQTQKILLVLRKREKREEEPHELVKTDFLFTFQLWQKVTSE